MASTHPYGETSDARYEGSILNASSRVNKHFEINLWVPALL